MAVSHFVTGASRGIGFEFVRQMLADPNNTVIAAVRNVTTATKLHELKKSAGNRLNIVEFDVADLNAPRTVANRVAALLPNGLDVLVLNAGILQQYNTKFEDADMSAFRDELLVNTLSPIATLQAFLPLLRRGAVKKVVFLTSFFASIEDAGKYPTFGSYSASKAGLNMAIRKFGLELKDEGFILLPINPGWVKTDMGGDGAEVTVEDSVAGMLRVTKSATIEDTTKFVDYLGAELPW